MPIILCYFLQGLGVFLTVSVLLQALSMIVQPLIEEILTLPGLFWTLAAMALLGLFYTNLCVYEIKLKTLKVPDWYWLFFKKNYYEPRPLT